MHDLAGQSRLLRIDQGKRLIPIRKNLDSTSSDEPPEVCKIDFSVVSIIENFAEMMGRVDEVEDEGLAELILECAARNRVNHVVGCLAVRMFSQGGRENHQ